MFWEHGYAATSIEDLTQSIQTSRHALYRAFADKRALLIACLEAYKDEVVSPAFRPVERPGADLSDISAYFEKQIAEAETAGFPTNGCLLANLMTEAAPHDPEIASIVRDHLARLKSGFSNALRGAARQRPPPEANLDAWASLLATTAQGIWSVSRVTDDANELRRSVSALLKLIEGAL
jgi:TetR/AcrR family transcriptional repressor of nem operon